MGLIDDIQHAQMLAAEDVVIQSLKDKGLMPDEPKTPNIGEQIDLWIEKLAEVKQAETAVRELKKQAEEIQSTIASNLDALGLDLARGKLGSAFFTESDTARLDDPQSFGDFVVLSNQPYLYQARIAPKAVLELLDNGEVVPGVTRVKVRKLSYKSGNK